jgi:hypothetical protein
MKMCCLVTILLLLGPRVAGVLWWILDTAKWDAAFGSIIWPILGIMFLPWTTIAYVFSTVGGISGFDVILIMIALVADVMTLGGGGYGNRKAFKGY